MHSPVQYAGWYYDSTGSQPIIIENDFKTLTCVIDGVRFSGQELSDLTIVNEQEYTDRQLQRFKFIAIQIADSDEMVHLLCNCSFSFVVPQTLIDTTSSIELAVAIEINCFLAVAETQENIPYLSEIYKLSLLLNGSKLNSNGSGSIEGALLDIQHQLGNQYIIKNCFGCMYGDYSVFGNSAFGSMICYYHQKEEYKQVTTKEEYMNLDTSICTQVQEIYCCEEFEFRKTGAGYRG